MKRLFILAAVVTAVVVGPLAVSAQSTDTSIALVHGVPGTTVDLVVDGTVILDAFEPGSIVDITSFAGRTLTEVELVDDSSGDLIVGPISTLTMPDSGNWSIVAHLDADGEATLSSFENDASETGDGEARLTVRHTAAAPAVDLTVDGQTAASDLENGASAELDLAAGDLTDSSVDLTTGGLVLDLNGIALAADTNTVVYVVGSADASTIDDVLQIITLPSTATTTTSVAGGTTTTVAGATSTTTAAAGGATTTAGPVPSAVNTGAPLDSSTPTLLVVALGGIALAGGAYVVRRRV